MSFDEPYTLCLLLHISFDKNAWQPNNELVCIISHCSTLASFVQLCFCKDSQMQRYLLQYVFLNDKI